MHDFVLYITKIFESMGLQGLAINAAIESCLPGFPLPPDFLLIAMSISTPQKALLIALVCTISSVFGGLLGYCFGFWGGRPLFNHLFKSKAEKLVAVEELYKKYGTVAVLISAFTPIPYNIFTIASGILKLNVFKFLAASILGRGGRFFFVSTILIIFGETIKQYLNLIIILVSILIVVFFILVYRKGKKLGK